MSESEATWSIYIDTARMLVDFVDEGPDPQGTIGSNWQPGHTKAEAIRAFNNAILDGWHRGSETNPRF